MAYGSTLSVFYKFLYLTVVLLAGLIAFRTWTWLQTLGTVTVTIPLGISPISLYESKNISAVDTDIPTKCSTSNCNVIATPVNAVDVVL